jgi:hypothetical protein
MTKNININFDPNNSVFMQCAGGVVGGQKIGKALFKSQPMQFDTFVWMGLRAKCLLNRVKPLSVFETHPRLHTALQLCVGGIMALNALNGYMGHIDLNNTDHWFDKMSIKTWDYSCTVISILSIFDSIDFQRPAKILTLLGSACITILNEQKQLPQRFSAFLDQAFGNTLFGKTLYWAGTVANLGKIVLKSDSH